MDQASQTDVAIYQNNTQNQHDRHTNGSKIALICCSVLTLAGIGFGIHKQLQLYEANQQIVDLKMHITDNDDSGTHMMCAEKKTEDTDNTIEGFGFKTDNLTDGAEYTTSLGYPATEVVLTHTISIMSPSKVPYRFYTLKATGLLEAHPSLDDNLADSVDITSRFPSQVVNLAIGQDGNGGYSWLIALLEDGTVATLQEDNYRESDRNEGAYKVDGANNIVAVYGNYSDISTLGYAQDKSGKIYRIVPSNSADSTLVFKLAN